MEKRMSYCTFSRTNDAPELDDLPQLDGAAGLNTGGEQVGAGESPEQHDLARQVLAVQVDRWRELLHPEQNSFSVKFRWDRTRLKLISHVIFGFFCTFAL